MKGLHVLIACAKTAALGHLEARYKRMRRVFRVSTSASLSNLIRTVSTCALANSVPCRFNARSRSMSTKPNAASKMRSLLF